MKLNNVLFFFVIFLVSKTYAEYPESFVSDGKIVNELKTEEYIKLVRKFLPSHPIILEAGSHGGQDTVILGKAWPNGYVYAFEPVEKFVQFTIDELQKHYVYNAEVFPYALAEKEEERVFHYSNKIGAASSLLEDNGMCDYQDTAMVVQCVNLDNWAYKRGIDHIDFMWLDLEGYELHVLRSSPTILKTVKVILTEVNFCEFRKGGTLYKELYDFLTSNGFTLYKIWGSPTWQGNALFVRSELVITNS
jgi:2-O-methyltransferase